MERRLQDQHTLLQQIKETLSVLLTRVREEMPEYGTFAPISEEFTNSDPLLYCGKIYLVVKHPPSFIEHYETKRYFDLVVKTPSDNSDASCYLASGNKAELLSYLANEAFFDEVQQKISEMADELRTDKFV